VLGQDGASQRCCPADSLAAVRYQCPSIATDEGLSGRELNSPHRKGWVGSDTLTLNTAPTLTHNTARPLIERFERQRIFDTPIATCDPACSLQAVIAAGNATLKDGGQRLQQQIAALRDAIEGINAELPMLTAAEEAAAEKAAAAAAAAAAAVGAAFGGAAAGSKQTRGSERSERSERSDHRMSQQREGEGGQDARQRHEQRGDHSDHRQQQQRRPDDPRGRLPPPPATPLHQQQPYHQQQQQRWDGSSAPVGYYGSGGGGGSSRGAREASPGGWQDRGPAYTRGLATPVPQFAMLGQGWGGVGGGPDAAARGYTPGAYTPAHGGDVYAGEGFEGYAAADGAGGGGMYDMQPLPPINMDQVCAGGVGGGVLRRGVG
jgi:hypothetical protein